MSNTETTMETPAFDSTYYERYYTDYHKQNPQRKLLYYIELIEAHISTDVPRRIHDIGCGFGKFLSCLGTDWELCGSDPSEFAIGLAKKEVPHGSFKVGSATDCAPDTESMFPGQFGVVTAFDVLEHVPDLQAVAVAVNHQLCDEGLFMFVVPVYDGLCGPIIHLLDRDSTHVHKWPRQRWVDWASEHFKLVEWSGILRYLVPMFHYYIHLPTKRFKNHVPAVTVICRKKN